MLSTSTMPILTFTYAGVQSPPVTMKAVTMLNLGSTFPYLKKMADGAHAVFINRRMRVSLLAVMIGSLLSMKNAKILFSTLRFLHPQW